MNSIKIHFNINLTQWILLWVRHTFRVVMGSDSSILIQNAFINPWDSHACKLIYHTVKGQYPYTVPTPSVSESFLLVSIPTRLQRWLLLSSVVPIKSVLNSCVCLIIPFIQGNMKTMYRNPFLASAAALDLGKTSRISFSSTIVDKADIRSPTPAWFWEE